MVRCSESSRVMDAKGYFKNKTGQNSVKAAVYLLIILLLSQCKINSNISGVENLADIDISRSHPPKELHIQTVADVEYVPLETTDFFLLDNRPMLSYVSDNYILIWQSRGDIFVFNREGKAIFHFNRLGQGPGEYSRISNVIFDEKSEEIFVTSNLSRIFVYSPTGEHKRTLILPDEIIAMTAYNFDDETMLVYDETGLVHNAYKEYPYLFVSKQDGSIVHTLNLNLPVRYSNRISSQTNVSGQTQPPILITTPNNRRYGEDFVIADISSDTIYMLTKSRDLTPLLVRKPSIHSSHDIKTVLTSFLTTDKFIFLWKIVFDAAALRNNQNLYTSLMYEIETGTTHNVSFVNDDFPSKAWIIDTDNLDIYKNMTAGLLEVNMLKDAFKEGKLKGKLEKLAETLDEEDNPVMMIVKFK